MTTCGAGYLPSTAGASGERQENQLVRPDGNATPADASAALNDVAC